MNRNRVIIAIGIAVLVLLGLYLVWDGDKAPDGAPAEPVSTAAVTASPDAEDTTPAPMDQDRQVAAETAQEGDAGTAGPTARTQDRRGDDASPPSSTVADATATAGDTSVASQVARVTPDANGPDTATPDTATPDTATPDTATPDTATPNTAAPDMATPDTAASDTAAPDSASTDTAPPRTASSDTGGREADATGGAVAEGRSEGEAGPAAVTADARPGTEAVPPAAEATARATEPERLAAAEPTAPTDEDGAARQAVVDPEASTEQQVAALARPGAEAFATDRPERSEQDEPPASTQPESHPLPSFDIVRISRDCRAVIAGRAMPRAMVTVSLGDLLLGEVMSDARGEWVLLPDLPLQPGTGEIRIAALPQDGPLVEGRQGVIVVVPDCDGAAGDHEIIAVRTDDRGQQPSRILQLPGRAGEGGNLRLDTVDYDEAGRLILSGRAEPSARVNIYANNAPVGQAHSDGDGRWSLLVDDKVPLGQQVLRLDQVTERGEVRSRVEFPFSRARFSEIDFDQRKVIVQPGNSLWRIARRIYGEGPRYTVIYQANVEQIRDPDLIYPGQIFTLPESEDAADRG